MKELDYYFSALFKQTNRIDYIRYALLVATISCLSYSIYAHGYRLYVAAIAAPSFQIVSWYLKTKVESIRYLANEFQKISMLYRAYGRIPSEFQLSHLKALVSEKISSEVEKKKENDDMGAEYNLESTENPREILMSMIHENSYWNHHLYKSVFIMLIGGISAIIFVLIFTSLFALPFIKIDPEYTIPRLAFTFLSFSLIYEVLEKAAKSYSSSKIMLEIDNELTRSRQDITEENLIKVFNQYCDIKESAPDVPYFVYISNRSRLNSGWNSRIQMNNRSNA
ncbi:MAG: hypothetical protein WCP96_21630 [Methylococcaceae bacterium]